MHFGRKVFVVFRDMLPHKLSASLMCRPRVIFQLLGSLRELLQAGDPLANERDLSEEVAKCKQVTVFQSSDAGFEGLVLLLKLLDQVSLLDILEVQKSESEFMSLDEGDLRFLDILHHCQRISQSVFLVFLNLCFQIFRSLFDRLVKFLKLGFHGSGRLIQGVHFLLGEYLRRFVGSLHCKLLQGIEQLVSYSILADDEDESLMGAL